MTAGAQDLVRVAARLFSNIEYKMVAAFLAAAFSALHPDAAVRTAVLTGIGLMAMDLIVGVYASQVAGESLSSRKFARSFFKATVYFLFPSAVFYALRAAMLSELATPAASGVATLVILTELLSIIENIHKADLFPVPAWLVKLLKSKIDDTNDGGPKEA